MSLSCFECERIGAFNTLIIFARDGNFDPEKPVSHYHNFYTDCAAIGQFKKVQTSRFAIVQLERFNYMWNTGSDGELLRETMYKLVDEVTLAEKLPKIFG